MSTTTLQSFGHIASRLRHHPPAAIETALAAIPPAYVIDGVSFWTPEAEQRVDEELRRQRAEAILGRPIAREGTRCE